MAARKRKVQKDRQIIPGYTGYDYSDKQKEEAITLYLALGNMAEVSRVTGIQANRLRLWKKEDWWKERSAELQSSESIQVSKRIKKIVDTSLDVMEDRLTEGNYQYDQRQGKLVRVPVNAKEAGDLFAKSLDRKVILDKLVSDMETREEDLDKLNKTLESRLGVVVQKMIELSRFNNAKTIEGEKTNV
jgi:hypothetical protein